MTGFLDKLNLRPHEQRLVVVVALVVFIVLNVWFVWPRFGDWGRVSSAMDATRGRMELFKKEIARLPQYQAREAELRSGGSEIMSEELALQQVVQNNARSSGIVVTRYDPRARSGGSTNQFFQEQTLAIDFNSGGEELVKFLVAIAAENSMIRVRELNIRPDPSQTRLTGNSVLVANYQRAAPAPEPAPAKSSAPIQAATPPNPATP